MNGTNIMDTLKARGFIKQVVFEDELYEMLGKESVPFYIGFDPTADSLHVGHFLALMAMSHMQKAGHKPIVLIGGGTGKIGDPSGRTDMRRMMTNETINHNCECFKKQMSRFFSFEGENAAIMVNNADWLDNLNFLEFMRDIGASFSVNKMLTAECFKTRMERGLSFFEFSYMLLQAYDFLYLFKHYGCKLECGGDDQWSNILAGADLIRRKEGAPAFAMTFALLTTSEGKKMGKTQSGAVWLDPNKTSPFEFYQYWRNIDDADVINCLRKMTFLPLEQIDEMAKWKEAQLNEAKEILATELTALVHGEEEAQKAKAGAHAIFGGGDSEHMPETEITAEDLTDGAADILTLLVKTGLCGSRSDARRNVQQGGVTANDEKVEDIAKSFTEAELKAGVVLRRGKKNYNKAIMK